MEEPNSEQTASLLSRMSFSYMDPVVISASKTKHLTLDQLPPLSDTDYMKNLEARSFKVSLDDISFDESLSLTSSVYGSTDCTQTTHLLEAAARIL